MLPATENVYTDKKVRKKECIGHTKGKKERMHRTHIGKLLWDGCS